ncbi:ankyrin repeat-containing protein ITN1-like [Capsicum galapagoense]
MLTHPDCIRSLWRWNKPLCEEPDLWGWNSLHYAVKLGLEAVVSDMLGWKKSLVYLPAGSDNDWTTGIHIAASEGDVYMINELLNHCPDCWDMLNSNNQNALHVAVLKNQDEVVRFLLDSDKCDRLVDEPDSYGNTPLHLLAASGNHVPELINHPRAKKMSFNKQNQTPLDIALSCTVTTTKEIFVKDLCSIGRFGKRDFEVKQKCEYMPNPNDETGEGNKMQLNDETGTGVKIQLKEDDQTEVESFMKSAQIHIVVATLIMTVTFAAGITLPGGFESDPDRPNQGMAILIRKTVFRAFVVFDAIAFTFSAIAIFIYFFMADESRPPPHLKIVAKLYDLAGIFQCLSMLAVLIAFATGMFATLSHSLGLAITVCSIGCLSILLFILVFIYITIVYTREYW